jgi:hypothetical protein
MDPFSNDFFDLPVFDAQPTPPEPVGYERAIREFDVLILAYRLRERPRPPENISEFTM